MWDLFFAGLEITIEMALAVSDNNSEPKHKLEEEILYVLLQDEMKGLQIVEAIKQKFMYEPKHGPVYLALERLEKKKLVTSRWPEGRDAALRRYYRRARM